MNDAAKFCAMHEHRLEKLEDKFDVLLREIREIHASNQVLAAKIEDIKQLREDVGNLKTLKQGIVIAASVIASLVSSAIGWVVKIHA